MGPSPAIAGVTIVPPVQVVIQDGQGATDTSFSGGVTVALGSNPSAAVLSGTLTVTAAAGVASFVDLSVDQPGTGYTLTASSSGLTRVTSASFDIASAPETARRPVTSSRWASAPSP